MNETKVIGQTKYVGFEVGARKTFPVPLTEAWDFFFSPIGTAIWFGKAIDEPMEVGVSYVSKEGIEGKLRVLVPFSHLRMSWKKKKWNNASTLQVRLLKANEKTTISFHQENLLDNEQREEMKLHWKGVLEKLGENLKP